MSDLDPAYDRDTALADLTRISFVLATMHDDGDVMGGCMYNPPSYEDLQGMAADLNLVIAFLSSARTEAAAREVIAALKADVNADGNDGWVNAQSSVIELLESLGYEYEAPEYGDED